MALLRTHAPVWFAASLLCAACGAGETGHVEVEHAVIAPGPEDGGASERLEGLMFSAGQSSRFEPDGLLLYFELALDDGRSAELEVDLPRGPGREAVVHYTESTDDRLTFESDAASGAVELAEDLDGQLCSCSDGRFDLRLTDDGADGEAGTADDQVRELRNGIYYWGELCERDGERDSVPLADLDRVEVRPVDHCMGGPPKPPQVESPVTSATTTTSGSSEPVVFVHDHAYDPYYDHHPHHVVYVESYGCGGAPTEPRTESSAGCGGSSHRESDSEASGCEGDSQASSSEGCSDDGGLNDSDGGDASGCDGSSDDASGSSGCDGDDHESASGCERDATSTSAALRPNVCAQAASPSCPGPRRRPHLLAGAFQNYLWLAFGAVVSNWRARTRLRRTRAAT